MRFNAARLLREPIGSWRTFSMSKQLEPGEGDAVSRIEGDVRLTRTDKGIWVHGVVALTLTSVCSRCLVPCEQVLSCKLDEEYLPQVDITTGAPTVLDTDDESLTLDERHTLDLHEAVRQYAITNAPMKLLCRPDCLGLCPQCGAELNGGRCDCSLVTAVPRRNGLEALRSRSA